MNKNRIIRWAVMAILAVFSQAGLAGIRSPVSQFQAVANKMLLSLHRNKNNLHQSRVINQIVNRVLMPYVDLSKMSRSVVGRPWSRATRLQKTQFKRQFQKLVVSTYAAALSSYNNDKIHFYPLRQSYKGRVTLRIKSIIIRQNGQRIPVSYDVIRRGSHWKVYDFSIEHISMVQSYRAQFSNILSNNGMAGLLRRLTQHNHAK